MTTVNLPDELVNDAKRHAKVENRSVPKQIAHCYKIGRIAQDNPDLPYEFIRDILIGMDEAKRGKLTEFKFD